MLLEVEGHLGSLQMTRAQEQRDYSRIKTSLRRLKAALRAEKKRARVVSQRLANVESPLGRARKDLDEVTHLIESI